MSILMVMSLSMFLSGNDGVQKNYLWANEGRVVAEDSNAAASDSCYCEPKF